MTEDTGADLLCRDCEFYAGEPGTTKGSCMNMESEHYQHILTYAHPAPWWYLHNEQTGEPELEQTCFEEAAWSENAGDEQTGGHA